MEAREARDPAERVQAALDRLAAGGNERARAVAEEAIAALLEMEGACLARMMGALRSIDAPSASSVLESWAADDLVASVLLVHGLHPKDLAARVEGAVERERARRKGVDVRVAQADPGLVRLSVSGGGCHGCGSSDAALAEELERAVRDAAPEVERVEVSAAALLPALVAITPPRRASSEEAGR